MFFAFYFFFSIQDKPSVAQDQVTIYSVAHGVCKLLQQEKENWRIESHYTTIWSVEGHWKRKMDIIC